MLPRVKGRKIYLMHGSGGGAMVLATIALAAILGIAGLAYDLGRAYDQRTFIQIAVEASAIAGAAQLVSSNSCTQNVNLASAKAQDVATNQSLTYKLAGGEISAIEVGYFDLLNTGPNAFVSCGSCPCSVPVINAVRVRASRPLDTFFARAVGRRTLVTGAESIGLAQGGTGNPPAGCLIPFVVEESVLAGHDWNDPSTKYVTVGAGGNPGNWGKWDLNGFNSSSGSAFDAFMADLNRCDTFVLNPSPTPTPLPRTGTGSASLCDAFNYRMGREVTMAATNTTGINGAKPFNLTHFFRAKLLSQCLKPNGQCAGGSQWCLRFELLDPHGQNGGGEGHQYDYIPRSIVR